MDKSSRHSKITGDFGERLILYWLSKQGAECALVDHTGIDIIARRQKPRGLIGISVKSRSRNEGAEATRINLQRRDDEKVRAACQVFRCKPYIAIVVDQGMILYGFLVPLEHARRLAPSGSWGMSAQHIAKYKTDAKISYFELAHREGTWRAL